MEQSIDTVFFSWTLSIDYRFFIHWNTGSNMLGTSYWKRKHSRLPKQSFFLSKNFWTMDEVQEKNNGSVCYTFSSKPCSVEWNSVWNWRR